MQRRVHELAMGLRGALVLALPLVSGCGWLLYPESTRSSGCPAFWDLERAPSNLAGTWSGTVTVTITKKACAVCPPWVTSRDDALTITFDNFGQPVGNESPWPAEWPPCLVAGATLTRRVDACRNAMPPGPGDPWRLPRRMDVETIAVRQAEFAPDRTRLVWHRDFEDMPCPGEGSAWEVSEYRTYEATLAGDVLNWSTSLSEDNFSPSGAPGDSTVTELVGQLYRVPSPSPAP